MRDAVLGQTANSLSSLAYAAAGAYVLRRGGPRVPAVALVAVGVGSVAYHGPMPPGAEALHDGSIAALAVTIGAAALRRRSLPRPPALALAAMAAGAVLNLLTRTGAPLCRPDSYLQGHAGWHVLTAVALALWLGSWPAPAPPPSPSAAPEAAPEARSPSARWSARGRGRASTGS